MFDSQVSLHASGRGGTSPERLEVSLLGALVTGSARRSSSPRATSPRARRLQMGRCDESIGLQVWIQKAMEVQVWFEKCLE